MACAIAQASDVTIIVDNSATGFSILSQTWGLDGAQPGRYGPDYRYKSTDDVPPGVVEWRPTVVVPGSYRVAVYYRSTGAGRPNNATYAVEHAGGAVQRVVNQQINGSTWVDIGTYRLAAGTSSRVTLTSAAQPGKTIVADAVRFEHLPADFDADGDVDYADYLTLEWCMTGPGGTLPDPLCDPADLDRDGDIDQSDFAILQRCLTGPDLPVDPECVGDVNRIPPRLPGAMTGSQFADLVRNSSVAAREAAVLAELAAGNIPGFLRKFVPITVNATINGTPHTAIYYVMPDYLSIGSDDDFLRMPMGPRTATAFADAIGCTLPTRKMVNDIHAAAAVKLAPFPFSPNTYAIDTVNVFQLSHNQIETQWAAAGAVRGTLVSGIKKDVVITALLANNPGKVAIYGWHQLNGNPIQPLFTGHGINYMDYSHGIRLVKRRMLVDGQPMMIEEVLVNPALAPLISDEGAYSDSRYP